LPRACSHLSLACPLSRLHHNHSLQAPTTMSTCMTGSPLRQGQWTLQCSHHQGYASSAAGGQQQQQQQQPCQAAGAVWRCSCWRCCQPVMWPALATACTAHWPGKALARQEAASCITQAAMLWSLCRPSVTEPLHSCCCCCSAKAVVQAQHQPAACHPCRSTCHPCISSAQKLALPTTSSLRHVVGDQGPVSQ
jgi:hypothetical protein